MRYQVGTQPIKVILGENQSVVSVLNDGKSTVYFDSNGSVTPDSGFPLAPTGQMTWNGFTELWAVTRYGETNIRTTVDGVMANTPRGTFDRILWASDGPILSSASAPSPILECGYLTDIVCRVVYDLSSDILNTFVRDTVSFTWYDENLVPIGTDLISVNCTYSPLFGNDAVIGTPVRGAYFKTECVANTGVFTRSVFNVRGDTRSEYLSSKSVSALIVPFAGTIFNSNTKRRNYIGLNGWNYGKLGLPSYGEHLTVSMAIPSNITGGASITIRETESDMFIGALEVPAFMTPQRLKADFSVPSGAAIYAIGDLPPSLTASVRTSFVWED